MCALSSVILYHKLLHQYVVFYHMAEGHSKIGWEVEYKSDGVVMNHCPVTLSQQSLTQ